ncbi:MAG TPA: MOP flippase family protein [Longimicrobiales bacterium]
MSLAREVVSGFRWSAAARFAEHVVTLITTVVLVRLLSPEAFGLLGMAMLAIGLISVAGDLGFSAALIQRRNISRELASSLFWISGLVGGAFALLVYAAAPAVAAAYQEPKVAPILRVLSVLFALTGFGGVPTALLSREFAFARLTRVQLLAVTLGAATGIVMALNDRGVWSLVGQQLTRAATETGGVLVASRFRPVFRVRWAEVRSVASYSLNLSGSNIAGYIIQSIDNLLIGRFLGATALGFYDIAWRLIQFPVTALSQVVGRVLFPALSSMQEDDARFGRAYLNVCSAIALLSFPMILGAMLVAEPFVLAVLGKSWAQTALLLVLLGPVGLAQSIGSTTGNVYMAKARTGWLLLWSVAVGIVTTVAMWVGLAWGLVGVAVARLLVNTVLSPLNFHVALKLIGLRLKDLGRALGRIAAASLVMVAALAAFRGLLDVLDVGAPAVVLAFGIPLGIATYAWALFRYRPAVLREILETLAMADVSWARSRLHRARLAEK